MSDSPKAPAGWYDHPTMANTRRYWDGNAWTDQLAETPPKRSSRAPLVIAVVVVVLVAAGAGLFFALRGDSSPDTFTASGTIELTDRTGFEDLGTTCIGVKGYDDIIAGAQVTIHDKAGKLIAVGSLDGGSTSLNIGSCTFSFKIPDVPDSGDLYSVEITHRGDVSFNKADAESIALSLG